MDKKAADKLISCQCHGGVSLRLTLGAMPVTAGGVSNLLMFTGLRKQHVTAQLSASAAFDGRHYFELTETDMTPVRLAPCVSVVSENIRYLQRGMRHVISLRS